MPKNSIGRRRSKDALYFEAREQCETFHSDAIVLHVSFSQIMLEEIEQEKSDKSKYQKLFPKCKTKK